MFRGGLQTTKDSPFVCSLQQRSHAHTEHRLHSPCCPGHNGHILATKRPPQWSHRESDHTHTQWQKTHCNSGFERAHFNAVMLCYCVSSHLSVTGPGIFETATQAVNSVDDELPGEVVLHSSADISGFCYSVVLFCNNLIFMDSCLHKTLGLTWHCVWREHRSSSRGMESCTPPPPLPAAPRQTHWTAHLE